MEVQQFYGVYLLYCENPQFKGRIYIGFTTDPSRRLKEHNKGVEFHGARRTNNKGPWTMVLSIFGFPCMLPALRFEWAWQHPQKSMHLRHIPKKKSREKQYEYRIRILSEMLNLPPWCRLPLTICWLDVNYKCNLSRDLPIHMPICQGPIISKKTKKLTISQNNAGKKCDVCLETYYDNKSLNCISENCPFNAHVICFSKYFLKKPDEYVPINGECPKCKITYLWGDLIKQYKSMETNQF